MKPRAARICLTVAIVFFVASAFVLGDATACLLIAAGFSVVTALLGTRWIRAAGFALVVFSVGMSIVTHQASQRMEARIQELRERAGDHEKAQPASRANRR